MWYDHTIVFRPICPRAPHLAITLMRIESSKAEWSGNRCEPVAKGHYVGSKVGCSSPHHGHLISPSFVYLLVFIAIPWAVKHGLEDQTQFKHDADEYHTYGICPATTEMTRRKRSYTPKTRGRLRDTTTLLHLAEI